MTLYRHPESGLVFRTPDDKIANDPNCCCCGNDPPVISTIPPTSATECVLWTYDANANDPEGDTLTWSLGGTVPSGMTIDPVTGIASWTPGPGQSGSHSNIRVIVTDECNNTAIQQFSINVANDECCENDPPEITSSPVTTATECVEYEYQVTADDPESDGIDYCLTVWPDGMSIDSSGLITWTPGPGDAGTHNVTVKVGDACHACEDGTGDQVQSFTIEVGDDSGCY